MTLEFEGQMGFEMDYGRQAKIASLVCAVVFITLVMAYPAVARLQNEVKPLNNAREPVVQDGRPVIRLIRDPEPAPVFAVKGLNGQTVSLEGARGKVVLLSFWATWCGPCRLEVPDLVELQNKYRDRLQVIGLVVDDPDEQAVREFMKTYGVTYPVAMATDEMRYQFGGVPALPTCFIIDAQGRVAQKHIGLRDPALYETEIRALLGMPIQARVETFVDTGEVFLKNASRASELPGVDMTGLSAAQKTVALHRMNQESCTCGCRYTLAQCRIYDQACQISQGRTAKIVAECAAQAGPASPGTTPVPETNQNRSPGMISPAVSPPSTRP